LYCKKKDGGLGFPKLETIVTSSCLKTGLKFLTSDDPVIRALAATSLLEKRLQALTQATRIEWPIISLQRIEQYKQRVKRDELARWAGLRSQRKAVRAFANNSAANAWLLNPATLKPSKFINALKMRANIAGDKVALARAKINNEVACRRCQTEIETLGHELVQCLATKKDRIKRHDIVTCTL
jgi:hypothetical protein